MVFGCGFSRFASSVPASFNETNEIKTWAAVEEILGLHQVLVRWLQGKQACIKYR